MSLADFIARHRLPPAFAATAERHYQPLVERIERRLASAAGETFVLGINGAQGSGKSTLAAFLAERLRDEHARNVAGLSIDDLYLTRAEREALAAAVHPLLVTRGVPGTHDVRLGIEVLEGLRNASADAIVRVPRFDKAADDRVAEADWPGVTGPVDLVIFEGWCVGSLPEPESALADPINRLEAEEDPERLWRNHVNAALAGDYQRLFGFLDALIFLEVPDFESVREWRLLQEHKLRAAAGEHAERVMTDAEVERFIRHFERITRSNLRHLPERADAVVALDRQHGVASVTCRGRL